MNLLFLHSLKPRIRFSIRRHDCSKIENSKLHAAMKRGKLESQKEIVLSMLERGLEEETIQESTGLSLDFIKSCRE